MVIGDCSLLHPPATSLTISGQFGTNLHHITDKHLQIMFDMSNDLVYEWHQLYCTEEAAVGIFVVDIFV